MWDRQALSRTLDRKENEAAIFSLLMKNSKKCDDIARIINAICNDIIFCKEILSNGKSEYPTSPIDVEAYTSRLSEIEVFDEDYLDSIRVEKKDETDAINVLKEELAECRSRIDMLSKDLDESQKSNSVLKTECDGLKETIITLKDELKITKDRNSELSLDLDYAKAESKADDDNYFQKEETKPEDSVPVSTVETENTEPCTETNEKIESADVTEKPVSEKVLEQIPDDPYHFTEADKAIARKVRAMKESKMDYFIDLSLSGKNVKASDDIVGFLKIDAKLCDLIDSVELGNDKSLDNTLNEMLSIVDLDYKSPYQHFYIRSLSPEEKVCETLFNSLMQKTQRIMMVRLGE